MKTFGCLLEEQPQKPAHQEGSSRQIYGARMVARAFLEHVLEFGEFDEYHFFSPFLRKGDAADRAQELLGLQRPDPRLKLRTLRELPLAVGQTDYFAFHNPSGLNIAPWLYLRNRFATRNYPITTATHTLSYPREPRVLLHMLLNGMAPWDSIVCAGEPARTVLKGLLAHLGTGLAGQCRLDPQQATRLDNIPHAIDAAVYRPRSKALMRRHLGLPQDQEIILWVGRFSAFDKADLRPLLLAFRTAARECEGAGSRPLLVLAGEDSRHRYSVPISRAAASLGIQDRLRIWADPALLEVPMLYSAADIFVAPSDNVQETFGLTVLEAMASGLPVVCSDWEGYGVSVLHGATGLKIPTYWMRCDEEISDLAPAAPWTQTHLDLSQSICVDVDRMAEALIELLRNPGRREQMGARARQHVLDCYDWRVVIRRYVELWGELKEIADHSPVPPASGAPWYRIGYFDIFSHYATRVLDLSCRVRASDGARAGENRLDLLPPYDELGGRVRHETCESILSLAQDWATVGWLQSQLEDAPLSAPEFRYHVLWLLKYNLLTLSGEEPTTRRGA